MLSAFGTRNPPRKAGNEINGSQRNAKFRKSEDRKLVIFAAQGPVS